MKRKVIFQRQLDSMQCGVAALTMVCRHFGADYTLDFIGQYCHATTEGVSMLGISQAAKWWRPGTTTPSSKGKGHTTIS